MELEVLRKDMVAAMKAKDKVTKEAVPLHEALWTKGILDQAA